jgi:hypothetical protein
MYTYNRKKFIQFVKSAFKMGFVFFRHPVNMVRIIASLNQRDTVAKFYPLILLGDITDFKKS